MGCRGPRYWHSIRVLESYKKCLCCDGVQQDILLAGMVGSHQAKARARENGVLTSWMVLVRPPSDGSTDGTCRSDESSKCAHVSI